jgi:ubiquinone/menaquinone biosynthesis C-methylase UbiE
MNFYNDPKNVKKYIQMCEGYDGSNIYQALGEYLPVHSTLLELGSGAGLDIVHLKNSYTVTGSDLSDEFLKVCKEKHPDIPFLKLNALKLEVDEKFNCIFSNKVLHHLTEEELKESLQQQASILSPSGLIAHSFWLGKKNQEMNDLLFTYYIKEQLLSIISKTFEVSSSLVYEEIEEGDSLLVIARLKDIRG